MSCEPVRALMRQMSQRLRNPTGRSHTVPQAVGGQTKISMEYSMFLYRYGGPVLTGQGRLSVLKD